MIKQPWLSVIIPTYNGSKYLPAALNSVIVQQDDEIECVVIDDGSTDDTLAIVASYQDKLNIKLITKARAGNWVANTNHALSVATSKYACFLHQDDLWLEGRLQKMKKAIANHPKASLYLHDAVFIDSKGKPLGLWQCPLGQERIISLAEMKEKLLVQNFIAIPSPIFNRQTALNLGTLNSELWYTADWDFWLKLASMGDTYYVAKPLAAFRVHGDSQTIRRSSSVAEFRQQMRFVVDRHLNVKPKSEVAKVAFFSTEVNTTLAAMVHGESPNLIKLGIDFLGLGPMGWRRYWQDSRIQERVFARLKAKLQTQT
ncbi:glycosyltransferase [Waterburya agarophytonicola K14]|uniref:Glycosyltransferase n=1 Tax=Waterburya agarophytonicola KI4 TaxID=2874699 RepID=A0A964FFM1_9CYAN|nr:glycosyltransferase [Waterburya agarophytonicola]MCC0175633.1 glycosyltransferase [Waterburya agarophytonicola KI4]